MTVGQILTLRVALNICLSVWLGAQTQTKQMAECVGQLRQKSQTLSRKLMLPLPAGICAEVKAA